MTRLAPLLLFIALALMLGFILLGQTERRAATESGAVETALPPLALQPFSGKKVWDQNSLQDQITILNFFASWCTPCAAEMPELAALKKQYPDIKIIGVVWNDDPKSMHAFLKAHGNPFDEIWLDPKGNATMALGIKGIPESIVVDAVGLMRYRLSAPLTAPLREGELGALLKSLLNDLPTQIEVSHGL